MKRIFGVTLAAVLCYAGSAAANPVNLYDFPIISEFQMTDSTHWAIELNAIAPYVRYASCSTAIFRLRVVSSARIYNTKIYFDTAKISVLTRESITSIPPGENVVIHTNDTIQILDSMWNDSTNKYRCWKFVVRPVKTGNSLVDLWYGYGSLGDPFETSRPSIGTRGNYTSLYNLYLRDSLNNLLSQVYYYNKVWAADPYNVYFVTYGGKLISPTVFQVSVGLSAGSEWRGFSCDSIPNVIYLQPSSFPSIKWNGSYIDTVLSIQDTVICPCAPANIKKNNSISKYLVPRFSALPRSGGGMTFVIATPSSLTDAFIRIYDISGKVLASLKVNLNEGGTHSIAWDGLGNNHKKLSAGTYLCKLVADGTATALQNLTVR